jgi:uncharacterized RDD family membrane protein YckC
VSDDNWFYAVGQQQQGPVTLATLRQLLGAGQIRPTDLVWNPSMPQWAAAQTVTALSATANAGVARMAEQGYMPPAPGAMPGPGPAMNYGAYGHTPQAYLSYAGFWLRFVAFIIDVIVTNIIGFIFGFIIGFFAAVMYGPEVVQPRPDGSSPPLLLVVQGVSVFLTLAYYTIMECSPAQATVGKMALGLKVTDLQGQRISFANAMGRTGGKLLSSLTLGIGFIIAAFTEKKQALHDMIAGTLVVRKN